MEALDPLALIAWIYDPIEERFGRVAAWLVTFGVGLAMVAFLVWILVEVVSR